MILRSSPTPAGRGDACRVPPAPSVDRRRPRRRVRAASFLLALTAVAIVDDLGAVIVLALFYPAELNLAALVGSLALASSLPKPISPSYARPQQYTPPSRCKAHEVAKNADTCTKPSP